MLANTGNLTPGFLLYNPPAYIVLDFFTINFRLNSEQIFKKSFTNPSLRTLNPITASSA